MKTNRLLVLATILALTAVTANTAMAWYRPFTRTRYMPVPRKVKTSPLPTIASVSDDSISVKDSKTTETFKIDKSTVIHLNNQSVSARDLKPGMKVEVKASLLHPTFANSITATVDAASSKSVPYRSRAAR